VDSVFWRPERGLNIGSGKIPLYANQQFESVKRLNILKEDVKMRKGIVRLVWLVLCLISIALVSCGGSGGSTPSGGSSDTTAPSVPTGLTAIAGSSSSISLNWTASTDDVGVIGYRIFKNGTQISTSSTNAYNDAGLVSKTTYTYTVSAYDAAENNSPQSSSASATTFETGVTDTTPPTAPTNLIATTMSSSQIDLSWSASTDDYGVAGYEIYRDAALISTVTGTDYAETYLSENTTYTYSIKAFDGANNKSAASEPASATTLPSGTSSDTQAPSVPIGLSVTAASSSQINLSWSASTDNVAVTGYKIYRDGAYLKSVATVSTLDSSLTASTQYCYAISAYDAAGNESSETSQSCAITKALWAITTITSATKASLAIDQNNNVHIAYRGANDEILYTTNALGSWTTSTVANYNTGNTAGPIPSVAVDYNNNAHISYIDYNTPSGGQSTLKYVTNESGSWVSQNISTSNYWGEMASIAIDPNNKVHIAYPWLTSSYDSILKQTKYDCGVKYASNTSGSWIHESEYSFTSFQTNYFTTYKPYQALALDLNLNAHTVINTTDWTNVSGTWASTKIEDTGYSFEHYPSAVVDSNNMLHVTYYNGTDLKYATNASGSWVSTVIVANPSTKNSSIAFDANGKIHVVNGTTYLTNESGAWASFTIDSSDTTGLSNKAIALGSDDTVHVIYASWNSATSTWDLKYAVQQ
jgi:chitodextrinase